MSKDKALINQLRSALEKKSGRLDELGLAQAMEKLKQISHSLTVKNHKKAARQLEQFTRQLIELFQD
ncbi:MAG: hypothetical protein PVJ09_03505 [Candidatus Woesebacteria bacterium]|jgi:hypothetical protein